MVAVVIVTHGHLAQALLDAAQLIVGEISHSRAVGLDPSDGPKEARRKVVQAIAEVDDGDGVLLLVDLPGGTPCTVCMSCQPDRRAEVVSGVNLSMLVKVSSIRAVDGRSLRERAAELANQGGRSIKVLTVAGCGTL